MRVILIDANNQRIVAVDVEDGLASLQQLVGGYIEVAMTLPRGHVLYVDEDGLAKPQRWFFRLGDNDRPFAGNGVIVGPEHYDGNGEYVDTADATILPKAGVVRFMSRREVDAWAKATASEPEITFTDENGVTEVIAYRRQLWGDMPRPQVRDRECLDCGHTWTSPRRMAEATANLSGEPTEYCPHCNSRNVMSSPARDD